LRKFSLYLFAADGFLLILQLLFFGLFSARFYRSSPQVAKIERISHHPLGKQAQTHTYMLRPVEDRREKWAEKYKFMIL
jgi:hypothetical protein